MKKLLAIDAGIKTGLALFRQDGQLLWYRSKNFGTMKSLKRGMHTILASIEELETIVIEGGGDIAKVWARSAAKRGISVMTIHAENWRGKYLTARESQNGKTAKSQSIVLAKNTVERSGLKGVVAMRHDAAEAILIGEWALEELGLVIRGHKKPGNNNE